MISTPKVKSSRGLLHDLVLPTLLFAALGGMTWAVRGSSGFGAVKGCVFAGVMWGTAWWFLSLDRDGQPMRRYSSGWIVLALTVGIGISGARGWMQWPSFFEGRMLTNYAKGESVPISRAYGFLWLFIAGIPWAGLGACLLAWCGAGRPLRAWEWSARLACGFGMAWFLGEFLFERYPNVFLPLYGSVKERYLDLQANPNLRRLVGDNHLALRHLGFYLGFLFFEMGRRDWKNATLILSVGLMNGLGWALCQNWKWAPGVWPNADVNWWRCWESCGGISIGIAYGIAFYLVNRKMSAVDKAALESASSERPSYPRWLAGFALMLALGFFMRGQLQRTGLAGRGGLWANVGNIYLGIVIVYGVAYSMFQKIPGHGLSDQERAAQLTSGRADLDWLAIYFSLLSIIGLFTAGEMRGWSQWFAAALAVFGIVYCFRGAMSDPKLERLGVYLGVLLGLGLSIKNGLRGWANIYPKTFPEGENYWGEQFWKIIGPIMLACLVALLIWRLIRSRNSTGNLFPHALWIVGIVFVVQNVIAQMITGPWGERRELHFNIYYLVLFLISGSIVLYFHLGKPEMREISGGKKKKNSRTAATGSTDR